MSLIDVKSSDNKFWLQDPKILYTDQNYLRFVPTHNMTNVQKLNAITRFCIYSIILLIIFGMTKKWIYIPIMIIIFSLCIYGIYVIDPDSKPKEINQILVNRKKEQFTTDENTKLNDIVIESGVTNSDGIVNLGRIQYAPKYGTDVEKSLYTLDELDDYRKYTCRKPTPDNPYMNPFITDHNNTNIPEACNSNDNNIKDEITKNFNRDLFMDVDDAFDKANSQRQFYTVPNTGVPSNLIDFANWLYKSPVTCKEDQEQCLRYEDIRFKR